MQDDPGHARYVASTRDAVVPTAFGMAVAFLVVAFPPNLFLPAGRVRSVMLTAMAVGSLSCAAIAVLAWRRSRTGAESSPWFVAGLAGTATATSLTSLVALRQPYQTVNLMLTLVTATALIHVRRVAVSVALVVLLGWALAGAFLVPEAITRDTVSGMLMACVLAVILHVSRVRNVARLDAARAEIAALAVSDELTGVGNRRALMLRGSAILSAAHRTGQDVALLFVDVDGLKIVNDKQGHAAGDELIATVATTLRSVFRRADLIARVGGDEFAVLLAGINSEEAGMLRQRLDAALAQAGLSASCGAAYLRAGEDEVPLDHLLDRADLAMYTEKNQRRQAAQS